MRTPTSLLVLAGLGLGATASAAIINTAFDAAKRPQADVRVGMTENDNGIRGMDEAQVVTATAMPDFGVPLNANQIWFSCHLLHFDPVNDPQTRTGAFKFDHEIIGVITNSATLDAFDAICNDGGGMVYPAPGAELYRGLEPALTPLDSVVVSQSPATGAWDRITVTAEVASYSDQVRVITCNDAQQNCHALATWVGWGNLVMP